MKTVHTIADVRDEVRRARERNERIGFVPTMGALHEGHGSLIAAAHSQCDFVVVSIFVNPLQFGPTEDFDRYPRVLEADANYSKEKGAHLIFAPSVKEMYPSPALTTVNVAEITSNLCGASRPGHFAGVATVVAKLFNIVAPDAAFFGQKDAQQAAVIRRMIEDLNFPLELIIVPTFRETDGLAMSSRNRYLSPTDRQAAVILYKTLQKACQFLQEEKGTTADELRNFMQECLAGEPRARLDYAEVVNPRTMDTIAGTIEGEVLLVIAAYLGETRLIDNMLCNCCQEVR